MPLRFPSTASWARNIDAAPVTAAPLTMACWYRPQTLGTTAVLMQLGDYTAGTTDHKFRMLKSSGNQLQFIATVTSSTTLTNTQVTMAANTWYHCLVSANATYSPNRAVVNGVVATSTLSNRVPTGVNSVVIGAHLQSTSTFVSSAVGDIFWPAIWNAQLTAEEERALAEGISPRFVRPQNLVFFAEEDDQRRIWEDAIAGRHLSLSTGADTAQYVPDIPPQVLARNPRRTARIYAFPAAGSDINLTQSAVEALTLTEFTGTVGVSIDLAGALETLTLTEFAGTVGVSIDLTGTLEALTLAEFAGVTGLDMALTGALETLDLTEFSGTLSLGSDINLTGALETLALTEFAGTTGVAMDLTGALETLDLTEFSGTVTLNNDITLSGNLETLSLTEFAGVTGLSMDLTGQLETLALTEFTGQPGVSMDITGALETLALTEFQGTTSLAEAISIVGNLETLALTEFAGTITLDVSLTGVLEVLALTEFAGVLRLYDPLARVWRIYTTAPDERLLQTTVTQAAANSFVSNDEPDTIVNGV